MTSNSSWHSAAWVDAEKALAGTEQSSGGGKKTAVSCQNRWTAVRPFILNHTSILFRDCQGFQNPQGSGVRVHEGKGRGCDFVPS